VPWSISIVRGTFWDFQVFKSVLKGTRCESHLDRVLSRRLLLTARAGSSQLSAGTGNSDLGFRDRGPKSANS
jgi:hypothetical protein